MTTPHWTRYGKVTLTIWVTPEDRAAVDASAKRLGMSRQGFLRACIDAGRPIVFARGQVQ